MKLPSFKRITKGDYPPESAGLIETLSFSINTGIELLYQALNKSITLQDNVACTVKDVVVEVTESGVPKAKTSVGLNTSNRVLGITVLNAINSKNPSVLPTAGVFVSFYQNGKTLNLNSFKGLPQDQMFTLTLVIFEA
jgi:hypothetical protein